MRASYRRRGLGDWRVLLRNALGRRSGSRPTLWAHLRPPRLVHPREHRTVRRSAPAQRCGPTCARRASSILASTASFAGPHSRARALRRVGAVGPRGAMAASAASSAAVPRICCRRSRPPSSAAGRLQARSAAASTQAVAAAAASAQAVAAAAAPPRAPFDAPHSMHRCELATYARHHSAVALHAAAARPCAATPPGPELPAAAAVRSPLRATHRGRSPHHPAATPRVRQSSPPFERGAKSFSRRRSFVA